MRTLVAAAGSAALLLVLGAATATSAGGWTPTKTQGLSLKGTNLGAAAPSTPLQVSVALVLRDPDALQDAIRSGAQLTPKEFTAKYAPTTAAAGNVAAYLTKQGFTHVAIEPNRLLVTAQGTVAHADKAFATTIDSWSVNGKTLYANATAAKLPAALGGTVLSVLGLNDAAVMAGGAVQHKATNALPNWLQALVTQVAQQVQQTTTTITQTVTSTTSAV